MEKNKYKEYTVLPENFNDYKQKVVSYLTKVLGISIESPVLSAKSTDNALEIYWADKLNPQLAAIALIHGF